MRQACVQFDCISNNDNPFNNIKPFIFKPLQKRRVLVLSIIAAWLDHATWWNFPSWCRGGASHDHNNDLIMRPKMCLTWYSFLFEGEVKIYTKENKFFPTFELTTKYHILQYLYDDATNMYSLTITFKIFNKNLSRANNSNWKRFCVLSPCF